ncbi:MAG: hypothetical protein KIT09_30415 [Bryobacteraceae bacterium]|nr:hypothetical protein [Bryobacteraceae bacterium]
MKQPKQRRKPHGQVPADIAGHGFVADLEHEMSQLAAGFGIRVHRFRKNGDWFLAVRLPDRDELARIDRDSTGEDAPAQTMTASTEGDDNYPIHLVVTGDAGQIEFEDDVPSIELGDAFIDVRVVDG